MKLKLFFALILISSSLLAMQPTQWMRDAEDTLEREETAAKLIKTTHEALQKIKKVQSQEATRQLKRLVNSSNAFLNKNTQLKNEIERLLDLGADPNIKMQLRVGFELHYNIETLSLLEMAILNYPEIIELLLRHGAEPLGLHKALEIDSESIVRSLIQHGADPNAPLQGFWFGPSTYYEQVLPLHYTIMLRNIPMFKLLMDLGADPTKRREWDNKSTYEILTEQMNLARNPQDRAIYQEMLDDIQKLKRKLP